MNRSTGRRALKAIAFGLAAAVVSPLALLCRLHGRLRPGFHYSDYACVVAVIPTGIGRQLRRAFYRLTLRRCGGDLDVGFGSYFGDREAEVGDGFFCGGYCVLGLCSIGDDVMLGSRVSVLSGLEQHGSDDLSRPMKQQPGRRRRVVIGSDVWIGDGAIIGADVGDHGIVGAGAVVIRPAPVASIVGGNPARVIRQRGPAASASAEGPAPGVPAHHSSAD